MSKLIDLNSIENIDYEKVGLICGLEIHQQLDTGKLFCRCPSKIVANDEEKKQVVRRLRFSVSESGDVDRAAMEEFKKGKFNKYIYNDEVACLVDLDEEPPKGPNEKALRCVLGVGSLLRVNFFDKIQFMRKLIIDGSVTSGFQRTAIVGVGGRLGTSFGEISIDGINLEEDSCRNVAREDEFSVYSLDRQGIPLIEITTGPDIFTPNQAQEAAQKIGNVLRSFSEVKRGLGTIRQDVNVSIRGGARVEIKGAQNLKLLPEIVIGEIKRQKVYLSILEELKERGVSGNNFSDFKIYDVSEVFKDTESKVILSNLKGDNSGILAIKLNSFAGILGCELQENFRFATEISDRNKKRFASIKGLFHSDELPKYGIEKEHVEKIFSKINAKESDAFILLAGDKKVIEESLKYIFEIIAELIEKIPTEVRQVDPKGVVTKFSRPMPGAARMYPETDVLDIEISDEFLSEISENLPELYDKKIARLEKKYGVQSSVILELLTKYDEGVLDEFVELSGKNLDVVFDILISLVKDIKKREKVEVFDLDVELEKGILREFGCGRLNKKLIRELFVKLFSTNQKSIENLSKYLETEGLIIKKIDEDEIRSKIEKIISQNGGAPFGALMGICMKEFKGGVEGSVISKVLKELL